MQRTQPISQAEVEEKLLQLCAALEAETESFEDLAVEEAKKGARCKARWANEYISASGAVKMREAYADYILDDDNFNWKIAEALVKAKREKLGSIRSQLDAFRSINTNVRSSVGQG